MHSSAPANRARTLDQPARLGLVCGIATLVWVGAAFLPARVEAQAAGTMQVLANVARADQAWAGLNGARAMARSVDPRSGLPARRQLDLALAQVRWEPADQRASKPPVSTVTIQYLHN